MTTPPGPKSPALLQTRRFISEPVETLEKARRRYGETFAIRIARAGELVFLSDPPSIKALFSADRDNIVAPGRNVILAPLLGESSLLLVNGPEHLALRKLMLPPFHGERMRAYERVIESATERELGGWHAGAPFPLHPCMQSITLEVIMRAVFGVRDVERDPLRTQLTEILAATRSPFLVGFGTRIPALRHLPRIRRIEERIVATNSLLASEIAARRADPDLAERDDILSMLLAARDEQGDGLDDREIRDQLVTLLLAGHETTATSLAWTFDLLFRRPDVMERLGDETAGDEHLYLDAVIEESLRLRPVVLFTGRQLRKSMQLGGYDLPVGTVVGPAIYLVHTRGDLYDQPYAFRPERFLDAETETYSWLPFGGGTRRCIGAAFAQFEMRVVLRTILREVELRPASSEPERIVRRNVTLAPRDGTRAVLTRRLRTGLSEAA